MAKLVGGNTNSYLWTNAYGYRLCAQDAPYVDGVAEFSLTMYAPETADYALALTCDKEATLWHNNALVWNFVQGAYPLTLTKGTTNGYVLRLGAKRTPTGIDNAQADKGCTKFIENGHLMLQMNNRIYDAQGQLVR